MRASRDSVARWNKAYTEQTAAMFTITVGKHRDANSIRRLARAYRGVADGWRTLAGELSIPLWARHAAAVAAEEFDRRAEVEFARIQPPPNKE